MDEPRTLCADVAVAMQEPLAGTAPTQAAWLLVEVPGSWGPAGLTESGLPLDVAHRIERRAADAGVRVQLLRRPDRPTDPRPGERAVYLANCRGATPWIVAVDTGGAPVDLLELPLDVTAHASAPQGLGRLVMQPVALVCTHAKRDVCCAVYGQGVYRALHGHTDAEVWETSHTGGHRFAPNLVVLPFGLTFGHVDPATVAGLLRALTDDQVDGASLRGRAGVPRDQQAAEVAGRRLVADLTVAGPEIVGVEVAGDVTTVTMQTLGRRVVVQVRRTEIAPERLTSCSKGEWAIPTAYEVVHAADHGLVHIT